MWLFGYDEIDSGAEIVELYDLEGDPEEFIDISAVKKDVTDDLLGRLKTMMEELGETYRPAEL
jgi:hypothetical protein